MITIVWTNQRLAIKLQPNIACCLQRSTIPRLPAYLRLLQYCFYCGVFLYYLFWSFFVHFTERIVYWLNSHFTNDKLIFMPYVWDSWGSMDGYLGSLRLFRSRPAGVFSIVLSEQLIEHMIITRYITQYQHNHHITITSTLTITITSIITSHHPRIIWDQCW